MIPYDIEILISIYTGGLGARTGPLLDESISRLLDEDLIIENPSKLFHMTTRGHAHIEQLTLLALPVSVWIGSDGKVIKLEE